MLWQWFGFGVTGGLMFMLAGWIAVIPAFMLFRSIRWI